MRFNKTISIVMAFMIMSASFMTLCPACEGPETTVHFIAESCESHQCEQNAESHSCAPENCRHEICSDQSIHDEYLPNSSIQIDAVIPLAVLTIDDLFPPDKKSVPPEHFQIPPLIPSRSSTVLRI
jgi:hypothetical protein